MCVYVSRYSGELHVDGSLVAASDSPGVSDDIQHRYTFLGGVPNPELFSAATDGPFTGFVGCIRALSIDGKEVSLENDIISGQSVGQCPDDRCSNQPCANGGLCQDTGPLSTDFNCTCRVPFAGVTCEIFNPCNSDPCLNGGLCRLDKASTAGYRCICTALFIGAQCETPSKTVLLGCHIAILEVECLLCRWKVFQSITFIFCRLVYCLAFQFYWCQRGNVYFSFCEAQC